MAFIKPISDERELVRTSAASNEQGRLEIYKMLDEAEADVRGGDRGVSVATVCRRLRR